MKEEKEKEKSFEVAIKELEKIIQDLESGDVNLDDSINKYIEAMKLIEYCEGKLNNANKTINKIVGEDGKIEDFNVSE